jgi:peptidoglycan hydrolase-like protein with peptidoglycan-binding domain
MNGTETSMTTTVSAPHGRIRYGRGLVAVALAIGVLAGCSSGSKKTESTVLGTILEANTVAPPTTVAEAPPAAATAWPTLASGAKAKTQVLVLQYLLNAQGSSLTADGGFGKKTGKALSDFQTKQKLTVNGTADEATWAALATDVTEKSPANTIKALQAGLKSKTPALKITGKFDQATKDALAAARTAAGLPSQDAVTAADWQMLLATP